MTKKVSTTIGLLATLVAVYMFTGFFLVQPIGAIPEGATIWYFRFGLNIPFVASADGMLLKEGKGVSILGRAMMMGAVSTHILDRKILRLPYSESLYLWSTGGVTLDR